MKKSRAVALKSLTIAALLLGGLTACGGGGDDEAGGPIALSVQPTTVTFTAPSTAQPGECVAGGSATVFIYGGAAPYHLDNTSPEVLALDVTQVGDRGGHFTVTVVGAGCLKNGEIVVMDKLNNQVIFTVNNNPKG